jgi:hypothetical protein
MQEKEIKLLFHAGVLKSVTIHATPMETTWYLSFSQKKGAYFHMDAQRKSPRVFKTIDAAFRAAQYIGFRESSIIKH